MTTKVVRQIKEIIDMFTTEGKTVDATSLQKWVTTQVVQGTHYAAKYRNLKPGDFSKYFREVHEQPSA